MELRSYNPENDKEATHRIWREIGWITGEQGEKAMDIALDGARVYVKDIDGVPEILFQAETLAMRLVLTAATTCIGSVSA